VPSFFKSGLFLTGGKLLISVSGFIKNIIIARMITVEDFGIASTFALTIALVEMSSNFSVRKLLIMAPDGDDEPFHGTAHVFQMLRGMLNALILFICAGWIAALFDLSHLVWAFQILALIPLITCFSHMDLARFEKKLNFTPLVIAEFVPHLVTIILVVPLVLYFKDYRAMLWLIVIQYSCWLIITHVVAKRSYRLSWEMPYFRRIFSFGWPLLINGFLMFGIFQADKIIVGSFLNMETLGWFSAALTLTMVPTLLFSNLLQTFFFPVLSRFNQKEFSFNRVSETVLQVSLIGSALLAIGYLIAGPAAIVFVFGEKYSAAGAVIALLGLSFYFRTIRNSVQAIGLAKAESKLSPLTNLVRGVWILLAVAAVAWKADIEMMLWLGVIGEVMALIVAFYYVQKRKICNIRPFIPVMLIVSTLLFAAYFLINGMFTGEAVLLEMLLAIAIGAIVLALFVVFQPSLIRMLKYQSKFFSN